jgi:hypothetical protein
MFDPSEMQREEKLLLAVPPQILAHPDETNESSATSGSGTKPTCRDVRLESVMRARADMQTVPAGFNSAFGVS